MGTRRQLTNDIGATGLKETWGSIQDDFLREWNGSEKVKRVDEMLRNSPVIAALRMAIEMPIRDVTWQVVSDEGDEDPRVQLVNDALDNLSHSWNDHVIDALMMVFYGWSMFTITYEQVNGRMLWRKFKMLGHDTIQRWLLEDDGGMAGVQQWPYLWPSPIPIERMVIYRFRKPLGNPEGESILRPAWTAWYYVKNIQQVEAIGIERNLAGLPIIRPPFGASMEDGGTDRTLAERIVRNVRNDEQSGVVLPAPAGEGDHNRWHFELMSVNSSGKATDTDMVIARYEKRMLMSALAQFLMLGQDSVGALATFSGASDFFTMSINAIADIMAETFTKYAIVRLLELNGYDSNGVSMQHSPAGSIGMDIIGTFLQQAGSYITWTADDEVWLRGIARLPEVDASTLAETQEQVRAERAANAEALRQAMQREAAVDENTSRMAATKYDDEVVRREGQFQRMLQRYWNEQKEGVLEGLG